MKAKTGHLSHAPLSLKQSEKAREKLSNAAIAAAGGPGDELVKGEGYFYFVDAQGGQFGQSVMVPRLNDLSKAEWIEEWQNAKQESEQEAAKRAASAGAKRSFRIGE